MKKGTAMFVGLGTAVVGLGGAALIATRGSKRQGGTPAPPPQGTPTSAVLTGYPVPPTPQVPQVVIPQVPTPDFQEKVSQSIASGNPAQMRQVAAELRKAGNSTAAQALEQYATAAEVTSASVAAGVQAVQQILSPTPAQPQPAPPVAAQPLPSWQPPQQPPPQVPVSVPASPAPVQTPQFTIPPIPGLTTQPVSVPLPVAVPPAAQTAVEAVLTGVPSWPETNASKIDVAQRMAANLAAKKPWAEDQKLVKQFQAQEGLGTDGLYGPGTATRLGQQYGIIPPKPYYWSKVAANVPKQKADYRAAMTALSVQDPVRAAQWLAAGNV